MFRQHRPRRPATADDLLAELGRLTSQALERAELQRARIELAEALQREMLPGSLPEAPGLRTAARYAPARSGLDIGGDWYDGFRLADGSLGFSVGDVQGHDVEAAAFMGQVRMGLRAVAAFTADPGEVLSRTNDLLVSMNSGLFATCSFLRFDPDTRELLGARAGHVPTLWATDDGRGGTVDDEGGIPLGIRAGERFPVTRHPLPERGTTVLVTDGVLEGPAFPIEDGLENVLSIVQDGAADDPGDLAARVIGAADLTGHTDDAAVLVLRHDGGAT
ncbi:PP2C family protein-serine/threonine phosphatase [Streptomyces beihaiensis]|uniref:Serine/threonine-protein phosphatase n=1 Tax=Streptomyces beihaiensis TaxID=2984495 RepID=A0ABT3TXD3_9ACTN|nr:PP2C family protein-serine/threonine phosphatase [Streptomyces beihaiensis]MCX3061706.1 serine/threonine-protein phosphatase [Streptomyces beihaiensis]